MFVVVSAVGKECLKIGDFDLSHAFDPDMNTTEISGGGGELNMFYTFEHTMHSRKTRMAIASCTC